MKHIMLDLETMGTSPNAAIIAIGAVAFDNQKIYSEFYKAIDLESSMSKGGITDSDTILWWLQQNNEAREVFKRKGLPECEVLLAFTEWLNEIDSERNNILMWGNGAAFDNVILAQAFMRNGMKIPWSYWNDRCYRTIKTLRPDVKFAHRGIKHNALEDATSQAQHLIRLLRALYGNT